MTTQEQARRLAKLARRSGTFEAFIKRAAAFPAFFGFPGMGTLPDWKNYFETERQKPRQKLVLWYN